MSLAWGLGAMAEAWGFELINGFRDFGFSC